MLKLTADTITDEQIRALREQRLVDVDIAAAAMTETATQLEILRDRCRTRCAEIINERAADAEARAQADAEYASACAWADGEKSE